MISVKFNEGRSSRHWEDNDVTGLVCHSEQTELTMFLACVFGNAAKDDPQVSQSVSE